LFNYFLAGYVRGNVSLSFPCGASTDFGLIPQAAIGKLIKLVNMIIFKSFFITILKNHA